MPERRLQRTRAAYAEKSWGFPKVFPYVVTLPPNGFHPDGSGRRWCPRCLVFVAPGHDCPFLEHDQWGV